jgi:hypothetical protein
MREHDQALLILGGLLALILIGMLVIEWLMGRDQDALFDEFTDSATMAAFDAECARFRKTMNEAELRRQQHLDESEASDRNDHQPAV